jgi:hypothetical protein
VAEEISRHDPDNATARKFYAQSLIDTGKATVAIDVLQVTETGLRDDHPEKAEVQGLLGRAYKQIFIDTRDSSSDAAKTAIRKSVEYYRRPFKPGSRAYWQGINLCAVSFAARRRGVDTGLDYRDLAKEVLKELHQVEVKQRDLWWSATEAEAQIALGQWEEAERACRDYIASFDRESFSPFYFAATLRQFRDVWEIHRENERGAGLLQLLESKLAELGGGAFEFSADHARAMRSTGEPPDDQRERVLGTTDTKTLRWYRNGLNRFVSVASIRKLYGNRIGTGFAIRARDLGLPTENELLVMTNFHVVNRKGAEKATRPEDVEITFEAAGESDGPAIGPFHVQEIVAESSFSQGLDYTIIRLKEDLSLCSIDPCPLYRTMAPVDVDHPDHPKNHERVYIIGHPRSDELSIALQDNYILDHELPPGKPPDPRRRRVHYHAPTAKGNSGSPVFDENWRCVALHHTGSKYAPMESLQGMRRLNGRPGRYSANEGIWIGSIIDDVTNKASSLNP